MKIFKKEQVIRNQATYKATRKFQGKFPKFTTTFNGKPPKTIKGEHGITFKRIGGIRKKKEEVLRIGKYTLG